MERPVFSVIIPMYNVEKYIAICIDSLLAQTFQHFELILVDDVSTDNTVAICTKYADKYPKKIIMIQHKKNTRQGGARNTGIDAARGKYILFVDSDDYLKSETLDTLFHAMEDEQADIVEFCHDQVDEQGNFLRRDYWPQWLSVPCCYDKPLLISKMGPCNKVFSRELFADGSIRFPIGHFYEDYWTVPKLLMRANKIVYRSDPFYCYRQHPTSTTHAKDIDRNRSVLDGTDALLEFFRTENINEDHFAELEYLAIEHVLIHATLRINSIDPHNDLQKEIKLYMQDRFPNWHKNIYLHQLSARKQQLLKLIDSGRYGCLYLAWHVRNQITGTIKQLMHKFSAEALIHKLNRK